MIDIKNNLIEVFFYVSFFLLSNGLYDSQSNFIDNLISIFTGISRFKERYVQSMTRYLCIGIENRV